MFRFSSPIMGMHRHSMSMNEWRKVLAGADLEAGKLQACQLEVFTDGALYYVINCVSCQCFFLIVPTKTIQLPVTSGPGNVYCCRFRWGKRLEFSLLDEPCIKYLKLIERKNYFQHRHSKSISCQWCLTMDAAHKKGDQLWVQIFWIATGLWSCKATIKLMVV